MKLILLKIRFLIKIIIYIRESGQQMKIDLYKGNIPYSTVSKEKPEIISFLILTWYKLPAIIVLPGGGYAEHAAHEAEPIAQYYNSKGFHSFVLKYRLLPNVYPSALCDVQALIKYLRANADDLKIDLNKIFVIGFSAGGHLAALSAVSEDICQTDTELDTFSCKPSGVLLGYPVITSEQPCVKNNCGNNEKLYEQLSIERQIKFDTPKMFIWHTSDDNVVDVTHSLKLANSLKENNIKFEMHIFPSGEHGLGLGLLKTDISKWAQLSVDWITKGFL